MRKIRTAVAEFLKELLVTLTIKLLGVAIYLIVSVMSTLVIALLMYFLMRSPTHQGWDSEALIIAVCPGIALGFFLVGPYLTLMFFFLLFSEKIEKKKKRKRKPKNLLA